MSGMLVALLVLGMQGDFSEGGAPTHLVEQKPVSVKEVEKGVYLVDFGKVAFGNILLSPPAGSGGRVTVRFGEALKDGRVDQKPPGTVRYSSVQVVLEVGKTQVVAPPVDGRNTQTDSKDHPPAILTPKTWGVVTPFRWVEIEGWPGDFRAEDIKRRAAFASSWDDKASAFECSDPMVNKVWDLCKYSIKATTFAGMFVDGDRERIPYEADAYLNQLSYYATNSDTRIPRATFDHLMKYPTWPTEWGPQMVFMAYADWMETGDKAWLLSHWDGLTEKLLLDRVGSDGLVESSREQMSRTDIVDWPTGERDGYQFGELNTVVNAFYLRALGLMAEMGRAIDRVEDADHFSGLEDRGRAAFQSAFFDSGSGLYRDGAGIEHSSLHANLFPLAFGLVPSGERGKVAEWLAGRGMKCSVYAAQYLLEGLFENGQSEKAIDLMVAPGDRSWRHMVESGATITWEAWDMKYKPNQDWNHAWGAAPANLLPWFVLGVQPRKPGWKEALIKPHPGGLTFARGKVPTPKGPVKVDWKVGSGFTMTVDLPRGVSGHVEIPAGFGGSAVYVDGKKVAAKRVGDWWVLEKNVTGSVKVELR